MVEIHSNTKKALKNLFHTKNPQIINKSFFSCENRINIQKRDNMAVI
jgi:hypothetical protein